MPFKSEQRSHSPSTLRNCLLHIYSVLVIQAHPQQKLN